MRHRQQLAVARGAQGKPTLFVLAVGGIEDRDGPGVEQNKFMDIRVQPGGLKEAQRLVEYGKAYNIPVIVTEFGN